MQISEIYHALLIVALIAAIVGAHLLYYKLASKVDSQMKLSTEILMAPRFGLEADSNVRIEHERLGKWTDRAFSSTLLGLAALAPGAHAETEQQSRSKHAYQLIDDARIYSDDVMIDSAVTFDHPVKVMGNLWIKGDAEFRQPVIVDGSILVDGTARFSRGVLTQVDFVVNGRTEISNAEGWLVARHLVGNGEIVLGEPADAVSATPTKKLLIV